MKHPAAVKARGARFWSGSSAENIFYLRLHVASKLAGAGCVFGWIFDVPIEDAERFFVLTCPATAQLLRLAAPRELPLGGNAVPEILECAETPALVATIFELLAHPQKKREYEKQPYESEEAEKNLYEHELLLPGFISLSA